MSTTDESDKNFDVIECAVAKVNNKNKRIELLFLLPAEIYVNLHISKRTLNFGSL